MSKNATLTKTDVGQKSKAAKEVKRFSKHELKESRTLGLLWDKEVLNSQDYNSHIVSRNIYIPQPLKGKVEVIISGHSINVRLIKDAQNKKKRSR